MPLYGPRMSVSKFRFVQSHSAFRLVEPRAEAFQNVSTNSVVHVKSAERAASVSALPTIHFSTVGTLVSIVFTSADFYLIEGFIGIYGLQLEVLPSRRGLPPSSRHAVYAGDCRLPIRSTRPQSRHSLNFGTMWSGLLSGELLSA